MGFFVMCLADSDSVDARRLPRCWLAAIPARSSSCGRRGGSFVCSKAATKRSTMTTRGTAGGRASRRPQARAAAGAPPPRRHSHLCLRRRRLCGDGCNLGSAEVVYR